MRLYFVRVQTRDDDFNVRIRATSKEHAEEIMRQDYTNIYQIDVTDITWSELEAAE
jgi:cytidylate kinase